MLLTFGAFYQKGTRYICSHEQGYLAGQIHVLENLMIVSELETQFRMTFKTRKDLS